MVNPPTDQKPDSQSKTGVVAWLNDFGSKFGGLANLLSFGAFLYLVLSWPAQVNQSLKDAHDKVDRLNNRQPDSGLGARIDEIKSDLSAIRDRTIRIETLVEGLAFKNGRKASFIWPNKTDAQSRAAAFPKELYDFSVVGFSNLATDSKVELLRSLSENGRVITSAPASKRDSTLPEVVITIERKKDR